MVETCTGPTWLSALNRMTLHVLVAGHCSYKRARCARLRQGGLGENPHSHGLWFVVEYGCSPGR